MTNGLKKIFFDIKDLENHCISDTSLREKYTFFETSCSYNLEET